MKGMRNRIAHGYFDIDLEIVWDTVQASLPLLVKELRSIMNQVLKDVDAHRILTM